MSLVLNEAGLASDAAFTVKEHFSTMPALMFLPEVRKFICCYAEHFIIIFKGCKINTFIYQYVKKDKSTK